jgi:hypothetical protein
MKTTLVMSLCLISTALAWGAPKRVPSAKHIEAGLVCSSCHQEDPPAKPPKMAVCVSCHGDFSAMAEITKALPVNPHDSHMDDPDCTQCHRQHQPPVVKCLDCHPDFHLTPK